jgi:hypothetical protein
VRSISPSIRPEDDIGMLYLLDMGMRGRKERKERKKRKEEKRREKRKEKRREKKRREKRRKTLTGERYKRRPKIGAADANSALGISALLVSSMRKGGYVSSDSDSATDSPAIKKKSRFILFYYYYFLNFLFYLLYWRLLYFIYYIGYFIY